MSDLKQIPSVEWIENAASSRWNALLDTDPTQPLREELAASGVSASTIASLYPVRFEDLVPGLVPLLTEEGLARFCHLSDLTPLDKRVSRLMATLPKTVLWVLDEDMKSQTFAAALADLFTQIRIHAAAELRQNADLFARTLAVKIWYACVLMAYRSEWEDDEEVLHFFITITEMAMPDFLSEWSLAEAHRVEG